MAKAQPPIIKPFNPLDKVSLGESVAEAMLAITTDRCGDWQRHTMQFTPGKNFPGTGGFGPMMVTADEVGDYTKLPIQTRLNGEVMQDASLADLIFPLERIIAYCSTFTPLSPGDVILSGTPGGVGDKRKPPVYMRDGDRVEVEIGMLGTLVNPVIDESKL